MKFLSLISLLWLSLCANAQVKHTVTQSNITFTIKNLGINTGGNIGGLQADILFDKDKPESSSIQASVDVNTINTDNDMRDTHLKGPDYFEAAKYPRISMKSVTIKHKSGNNYQAAFNITIKDKTKTINMPFTYILNGADAAFKGSFKILRTDFGIGDKSMVLGNDVTVQIDLQTSLKQGA